MQCKRANPIPDAPKTPNRVVAAVGGARGRLFVPAMFLYLAAVAGPHAVTRAASPAAQADTAGKKSVYYVTGLGRGQSTLREIGGEKVLEFPYGVKIVHEDVTITATKGYHYSDRKVTYLEGDVEINQRTVTMWGDFGEYSQPEDLAILRDNVRVVDRGMEVTCDEARYSRATGIAWLIGRVAARDSASTLHADSLYYNRVTSRAEAFGEVSVTNLDEGFTVEGNHGFYFRDRGEGIIDRNPHLIVDPTGPEPVTVDSDTMRVFPDVKHALAYYRVKILKGETVTQCDSAVIYDDLNRAELYGKPLAKQREVSMKGDKMVLFYDEEEVNKIDITGNATIRESNPDTLVINRENWIEGDTISLYLSENRVDSIRVLDNAVSEYYPAARNKVESNFVRGKDMFFRFQGDSLAYVRITGSADGVYKYVDLEKSQTCDSLRAAADSSLTYLPFGDHAEKVVYSARRIEYFAFRKDLVLKDSARIRYQNRTLSGDEVTYFSSIQMLDARGEPQLVDEGETFYGELMDYDMDAGSGLVTDGSTQFGEGYYFGKHVAKVGENEMKVWNSSYTTCDLKVPHYHFSAKEMKVFPKDKVISGPIWLYIGETPIAYLPFMANSIRRGRRSGILRPEFEFGITKTTGRYVRGFGYYWATSDYTDFTFTGHFNENASFNLHGQNRYALRYKFDGSVDFDFYRNLNPKTQNPYTNEWKVDARHNHTLGENFTVKSDLHFVSSDQGAKVINEVDDVERVVDRKVRSTLNVSKRWATVGFNASASRNQILNVTDPGVIKVSTTLPSVTLSIPSRDLYFGKKSRAGQEGFFEKLLSGIRYSPGLSGSRRTDEKLYRYTEYIDTRQSLSFSSPQKIWIFSVQPKLAADNSYSRTTTETKSHTVFTPDTTFVPWQWTKKEENKFDWNTGASMNTKFYGTFYPKIGRLRGIRHVVTPSASYSYTPKRGNSPARQGFSVSLQNALDLKVLRPRKEKNAGAVDTTVVVGAAPDSSAAEEDVEKLSSVVIWTLSSSYDPQAPAKKGWRSVSSSVNLKLLGTDISIRQSFEPYEQKLEYTQISTGLELRGKHPFGFSSWDEEEELNVVAAADTSKSSKARRQREKERGREGGPPGGPDVGKDKELLPWSFRADMSYTKNRGAEKASATLNMSSSIDLTSAWKISYSTSYDVEAREFRGQQYSISRDLHCWEMSFSRRLYGDEWQYYFKIYLRAHPEIYAENGRRGIGGFGAQSLTTGSFFR